MKASVIAASRTIRETILRMVKIDFIGGTCGFGRGA
jgi:hypothetical protein